MPRYPVCVFPLGVFDQTGHRRIGFSSATVESILLHLSAVRAQPPGRHEPTILSFVKSLHLDRVITVLAELVLDIWHKDVYNF